VILLDAAGVRVQKIQNPVHAHLCFTAEIRGMHGLDFGFFGSGFRLRPTGSGVWFSFL